MTAIVFTSPRLLVIGDDHIVQGEQKDQMIHVRIRSRRGEFIGDDELVFVYVAEIVRVIC